MINGKPVIALIAKHDTIRPVRQYSILRDEMKDVVIFNGGVPLGIICPKQEVKLLPYSATFTDEDIDNILSDKEKEIFLEELSFCDGVILAGGPEDDEYEIWVAKYCYDNDIPLLGVCAGQGNIARAMGGKLSKLPNPEVHYHGEPDAVYVHYLNVDKNSKFFDIVKEERLLINSRHYTIVSDAGKLSVAARDDEDNIEVIEDKSKKFYMATRYHPESLYKLEKAHNEIFKRFIDACRK